MIYDEFTRIAGSALKHHRGSAGMHITAIQPGKRGPDIRWEAPLLATRRERSSLGVVGPPAGPLILALLAGTLASRWRTSAPHCPVHWQGELARRHRRVFTAVEPSTGPGWYWLLDAAAQAIRTAGLPANFRTTDIKEKFGTLRWYVEADDEAQNIEDIIDAVDHLSGFICEDCGKPGKIRKGSWLRCLCNEHAK